MFGTLLVKEMHETFINFRFFIAVVLCVVLIPLSMYMSGKEYEFRLQEYNESIKLYQERVEASGSRMGMQAEGYRPPSPLSVFAAGLEESIPNKIVTSMDQYTISNNRGLNNPRSRIVGPFDFVFIVGTVLSMLAFMFTFGAISGEKEGGTLRLVLSNATPRHVILLAKMIGNFLMFIIPVLMGTLAGIILLILSGVPLPLDTSTLPGIVSIIAVSGFFLLIMFILGVLVSAFTGSSVTALIVLLLVWVVLSLVIPKTSPLIAQVISPVKSVQTLATEKQNSRDLIRQEKGSRLREVLNRMISDQGLSPNSFNPFSESGKAVAGTYDSSPEPAAITKEYDDRLVYELASLDQSYRNELAQQDAISAMIARLSPVSCFMNTVTEIAGTGMAEIDTMTDQAGQFYDEMKEARYDKIRLHEYYYGEQAYASTSDPIADGDIPALPEFTSYRHTTLSQAMQASMPDLALLGIYAILFFALSYVSFLRYDVR